MEMPVMKNKIQFSDFEKIDIRTGRILQCKPFPEARKRAYKLQIDFGQEIGIKQSSAQITQIYKAKDLMGKMIMAVVNLHPKQIGPFMSEVLVLGFTDEHGQIILAIPEKDYVCPGSLLH